MRILMAGASGFLGSHLRRHLASDGHAVTRLVRHEPAGPDEIRWDPGAGAVDRAVLSGQDIVINLAGVGVGDRRWTGGYKELIRSSRVDSTTALATGMARVPAMSRPAALLNASAVGWYGNTGDRSVVETDPAGDGFLAEVCRAWEEATAPAEEAAVRVVRMRTGLPLDAGGGFLKPLLKLFRLGVGGRLGTGRQYLPWIALRDWLDAVRFLIDHETINGPVNLTGPHPVTNAEFTRALAGVMHRPALLTVPRAGLRAVVGEFGEEALTSQRVLPGVLTSAGFTFSYPEVTAALRAALAAPGATGGTGGS